MPAPLDLAVFVSGSGTTLQNLMDRIAGGTLAARIRLVVGSRPGLLGVQRARDAGIPIAVVDRRQFADCAGFSREVFAHADRAEVGLVCLAGWLCLLDIPPRYAGKMMNIHPALLPSPFGGRGMFGKRVHEAVLAHGCKVSGCTVHFVDAAYDNGPIIVQRTCVVAEDDTPATLGARVFKEEMIAYPDAIRLFGEGSLTIEGRRVRVEQLK
ncbi:MAG TPA: phosphoribosylglycinamide formyltransferase [Tepidisphaeraceae bacterium]|jgi:phosphoribosylglycinamide formyltransferase-1|nr:phosphoribosylglycinamide formyltransferase [Tepidisphaeraceae bacterium]